VGNFEPKFLVAFLLVATVVSVGVRLLPHLPNFAPVAALALFAGVYGSRVSKAFLFLPLLVLLLSDLFLGTYEAGIMVAVYASFLAIAFLGLLVRKWYGAGTLAAASITGSVLFYLTTNFAVWAFSHMYPHTLYGLMMSYTYALPFFRNTLLGDLFYVGLFFGVYEFARSRIFLMCPRLCKT